MPAGGLPRLLVPASGAATDLRDHLHRFGGLPAINRDWLFGELERSGLRGRGGAAFPVATKVAAVGRQEKTVVIINVTEGEPASLKDRVLALTAPHLLLDGAELFALLVGASDAYLCVHRATSDVLASLRAAIAQRGQTGVGLTVHAVPNHYVAGESTAISRWIGGGEARPLWGARPDQRGAWGRPTLVQNAETAAQLAVLARHGAEWFRSLGPPDEPGSMLVTLAGDVSLPGVLEVAIGTPVSSVLERAGAHADSQAVLFGGHGGRWVTYGATTELSLSNASLATVGSSLGAGVIAVLGPHRCGLAETARLARWFADESAGQCGPCRFGLPAIAEVLEHLVAGQASRDEIGQLGRWLADVDGRGACAHPDLAVALVRSSWHPFEADIAQHAAGRPCNAAGQPALLPLPDHRSEPWR